MTEATTPRPIGCPTIPPPNSHAASNDVTVTFVNHDDLATAITNLTDAQLLSLDELQTPLSQVDLSALDLLEHKQRQISRFRGR